MNIVSATGLILRVRPYSETTLIVHWITPDLGRLATIAKGARRPKSPFRGHLDLFFRCQFSFARSQRSELHTLREVKTLDTHPRLRTDLAYVEQASYAAALLEQSSETESPLPELYSLFTTFLVALPQNAPQPHTTLAFELKLLHLLGLAPDLAKAALTPGSRHILEKFAELAWLPLARLHPSPAQLSETRSYLARFLADHLGKILPSRPS